MKPLQQSAEKQSRAEFAAAAARMPLGGLKTYFGSLIPAGEKWHWTSNEGNKNWGAQLNWGS